MNDFHKKLATGRVWEERVSHWLQENSQYVLDVYEYTGTAFNGSKSPKLRIVPTEKSLILPDLQVAANGMTHWVEIKSKSSFGFPFPNYRQYRTTGFDFKYWQHYVKVGQVTGLPVLIYFVHYNEGEIRAASLDELQNHPKKFVNQTVKMIYWPYDELRVIANIDQSGSIISV